MAMTAHGFVARPLAERVVVALLGFLGVTAFGGGFVMTTGLGGAQVRPPDAWLDGIPLVSSWVLPGLVLGLGFGVGSLVAAWGMVRRPRWAWLGWAQRLTGEHWSWLATVVVGAGQVLWIALELVYLPAVSWFHLVYAAVGLALALLPLRDSVRDSLAVPRPAAPRRSGPRSTVTR